MDQLVKKAAILHEALPYIQRFHDKIFVVKYGGHAMVDEVLKKSFARDVCLLRYVGIRVVVVHGGGPQINQALKQMGVVPEFRGGLRVTDTSTMGVVEMVLAGTVNSEIVGLIGSEGGRAIGLSGRDDCFLRGEKLDAVSGKNDAGERVSVDPGRVGRIAEVKPQLIIRLVESGFIPVVAPIAIDADGNPLNVNADTVAGEIAAALGASKLVLMTDVEGVKDAAGELIRSLDAETTKKLIASEVIFGGMIPKVQCALDAVSGGVDKVHIVDGRARHALLLEIFTDSGVGTEIHLKPSNS